MVSSPLKTRVSVVVISLLSVAGLSLTACTPAPAPDPVTVTVTAEAETPSPSPSSVQRGQTNDGGTGKLSDEEFADLVRENETAIQDQSTASIVKLAKASCRALDSGVSADKLVSVASENTDDPELQHAIGFIIGAGVANFCPQHLEAIQNLS